MMRWWCLAAGLCSALSSCSLGSGGDAGRDTSYYIVFDEYAAVAWNDIAFTGTNDVVALNTSGQLVHVEDDGTVVEIGVMATAVESIPSAGVFAITSSGYQRSSDGVTWQPVGGGLPPATQAVDLDSGQGLLWVAVQDTIGQYSIWSSPDGDTFEQVNVLTFTSVLPDFDERFSLEAVDGPVFAVGYHSRHGTVLMTSRDGGASFAEEADTSRLFPRRTTADGLLLARGGVDTLWSTSLPTNRSGWGVVRVAGIPNHFSGIQVFELDREGHLWCNVRNRMYRTTHVIDQNQVGRDIALAGPGCDRKHVLYGSSFQGGLPISVNVVNGMDDDVMFWSADPFPSFQPLWTLPAAGARRLDTIDDYYVMATDSSNICLGIQRATDAEQTLTFE